MLAVAFSFTLLFCSSPDVTREGWVTAALHTASAQAIIHSREKLPPPPPMPTVVVPPGPHEEGGVHHRFIGYGRVQKVLFDTHDLIMEGRFQDANDYISGVGKTHPEYVPSIEDWIIKAELLSGDYGRAYEDAVVTVATSGFDGEEYNLYLSFASAAKGQFFPGQAQYCQRCTQNNLKNQGSTESVQPLAAVQNPHDLMVLSAVALGTGSEPWFLEVALKLDPANDLAARRAILYYGFKGRYTDIRRVASTIADHLPAGEMKNYYLQEIANVAGLKDKPLHPVIKP